MNGHTKRIEENMTLSRDEFPDDVFQQATDADKDGSPQNEPEVSPATFTEFSDPLELLNSCLQQANSLSGLLDQLKPVQSTLQLLIPDIEQDIDYLSHLVQFLPTQGQKVWSIMKRPQRGAPNVRVFPSFKHINCFSEVLRDSIDDLYQQEIKIMFMLGKLRFDSLWELVSTLRSDLCAQKLEFDGGESIAALDLATILHNLDYFFSNRMLYFYSQSTPKFSFSDLRNFMEENGYYSSSDDGVEVDWEKFLTVGLDKLVGEFRVAELLKLKPIPNFAKLLNIIIPPCQKTVFHSLFGPLNSSIYNGTDTLAGWVELCDHIDDLIFGLDLMGKQEVAKREGMTEIKMSMEERSDLLVRLKDKWKTFRKNKNDTLRYIEKSGLFSPENAEKIFSLLETSFLSS